MSTVIWLVAINVFQFVFPASCLCCAQEMQRSHLVQFHAAFLKRFQQNVFYCGPCTQWLFRATGIFDSFFALLVRVSNQILLLTIHFQTGRWLLCRQMFYAYSHFGGTASELEAIWSNFILVHSTFSPIWIAFCVFLWRMFTLNFTLLLIFEVLMDPNGLPLQVINLTLKSTTA